MSSYGMPQAHLQDVSKVSTAGSLEKKIRPLMLLSLTGLEQMLMKKEGLFCFTVRDGKNGPKPEGISLRYTAMTLLGLHRAQQNGWPVRFDLYEILNQTIRSIPTTRNVGTLGLILWAYCELTGKVDSRIKMAMTSFGPFYQEQGNGVYATTELSWLLVGLIEASKAASPQEKGAFIEMAREVYRLLKRNFIPETGLFIFSRQVSNGWWEPLRSRLGFFDAQVYGAYAFAQYARMFSDPEALSNAGHCARAFCRFQGKRGEWAWHYNTQTGRVVDPYPIYSVHQHAMAPLGLKGLSAVSGEDFSREIQKGLPWIFGENPLQFMFIDLEHALIWRSMKRKFPLAKVIYFNKFSSFIGPTEWVSGLDRPPLLTIDRECRPYELGWLLFSFADIPYRQEGALPPQGGSLHPKEESRG